MFVLHSFMGPGVRLLGQEQFLAFYLSSAVFTSLASYVYKVKWFIHIFKYILVIFAEMFRSC